MESNLNTAAKMVQKIRALLPGGDCFGYGGCGKPTCQTCAEAIASGESVALCPACKQDAVDGIAEIMNVPTVEVRDEIAFVRCAGDAAKRGLPEGCKTCGDAAEAPGKESCQDGCLGIGSCIEVCKFNAMTLENGKVIIDGEKCTGCRACINAEHCPRNLLMMIPADATNFIPCASTLEEDATRELCGYGCLGCGDCEEACPEGAITMVDHHAVIDYEKCAGCVACTVKCKKKIIVDTLHDLTVLKETVAFVKCSGGRANQVYKERKIETCQEAMSKADPKALGICGAGCTGLGDCTKVCRYDAIHIIDGKAVVDPDKCVGCRDCTFACPKGLIEIVPYKGTKLVPCSSTADYDYKIKVCDSSCIACEDCVSNCPNGAIHMESEHACVDPEICENCQVCQYMCPRNIIVEQAVPEYNYLQRDALLAGEGV